MAESQESNGQSKQGDAYDYSRNPPNDDRGCENVPMLTANGT